MEPSMGLLQKVLSKNQISGQELVCIVEFTLALIDPCLEFLRHNPLGILNHLGLG